MNGTTLADIKNSIIAELKEEGIEPTLENITERLGGYIDKPKYFMPLPDGRIIYINEDEGNAPNDF